MIPFFSIIIPVYNVEKYLDRCLESVLKQQWKDYEIILVNDGSTDGSEYICKKYADRNNVILISKENGGLSSARNTGIDNAKGQYVFLLDSDDYIDDNCLSNLAEVIKKNKANIYIIKARSIYEDGEQHDLHPNKPCTVYERNDYLASLSKYNACAPYMVYNRQFLLDYDLKFYDGILHEDELWAPQVLLNAKLICYTNVLAYYHCLRRGSITQSNNYKKRGESLKIVLKELLKIPDYISLKECKLLRNRWAFLFLEAVVFLKADNDLIKQYPRLMLFDFSCTRKMKAKSILYAISPKLYCYVHKMVK
jgi:glycosyltransferase involved in cell wall biosynthesis